MRARKCCCCIPVIYGVKILGLLDILLWVSAASTGDIFNFAALLLTSVIFIRMLIADSERIRKAYFIVYSTYRVLLLSILTYYCVVGLVAQQPSQDK